MIKVLFLESGTAGGGSFESLHEHLKVIDRDAISPVVVYLNRTRYFNLTRGLGIPCHVFDDPLLTPTRRGFDSRVARILSRIGQALPGTNLHLARQVHLPLVRKLAKLARDENVDLIHANDQPRRDLYGLFVSERSGIPCVCHLRSMRSGPFDRRLRDYVNHVAAYFIANSEATATHWVGLGLDETKLDVVHNSVSDDPVPHVEIPERTGFDGQASFLVGCVGGLVAFKGHAGLLQSFADVVREEPSARLILVGDGALRADLDLQVAKLGIREFVSFMGYVANAKAIIASLDVLVVPSLIDTFGRVAIEALRVGTPVVAYDVGGIREAVTHDVDAWLVSPEHPGALSESILHMLRSPQLRARLGSRGKETASRLFSPREHARTLHRIYLKVLDSRPDPSSAFAGRASPTV